MTLDDIQRICRSFPEVTEEIKWEDHLCFCTGTKMFLITSPSDLPVTASFKTTADRFEELIEREGFRPAPYLGKHHWVWVDNISRMGNREWKERLTLSYDLVRARLPKKKK